MPTGLIYGILQNPDVITCTFGRYQFCLKYYVIFLHFAKVSKLMKLAIVGVTGLVGKEIIKVIEERNVPVEELIPVASEKSVGSEISFRGESLKVVGIEKAIAFKPDLAIFSAGSAVSLEFAPKFAKVNCFVVDNSSAWRMNPDSKLVIPEINGDLLEEDDLIIANPNCSTIQMVMALAPLHDKYKLKRIVVSTYQSVTGTGKAAVDQLIAERSGQNNVEMVYPHAIDMNVLPHIDVFMDNGYTKEEMKMIHETHKILGDDSIAITATAVRLPVLGGHSESVNAEFHTEVDLGEIYEVLDRASGITVVDEPESNEYPMPIDANGKDDVFVGRIRRDESQPNTVNMWIVADNLRKGAATNAVQIAEKLMEKGFVR